MARTKRVQVLMEPEEFRQIAKLAKARHSSVSDLMRQAARAQWLDRKDDARRAEAAHTFLQLPDVPLPSWRDLKRELEERRG